ncbi:MAG TPA: DUF2145 domain-containing protein [Burkholderiaceae bacterium]|nr:DUF2145 domain-containing protein [Burkholderiaceae bacterium]
MILPRAAAAALLALAACTGAVAGGGASSHDSRYCDRSQALSAAEQDRLLRFAGAIGHELDAAGIERGAALVARSGLDLSRFGLRYSHAGIALRRADDAPWQVRQLYFACDEGRPRIFDQGLAGFVFGTDRAERGFVSIVVLPQAAAAPLAASARDDALALALLGERYSANAYAFGLAYQNCNQWIAELFAAAWGALAPGDALRARAQAWLAGAGYAPPPVEVKSPLLMLASVVVPWVHRGDHPAEDIAAMRFRTSVPAALEAFVRERWPGTQRIELCHTTTRIVVRRGWEAIGDACEPGAGDRVVPLD